jgi:hypothetical protein
MRRTSTFRERIFQVPGDYPSRANVNHRHHPAATPYISVMTDDRARTVALTEAAFRIANERMARWEERHRGGAEELYMCECATQPCRERVSLTREQYEAVRSDVLHFLVVPGHVIPELESVVQSYPWYEVIEKPTALMDLLVETDPRHGGSGQAADAAQAIAEELDPPAA